MSASIIYSNEIKPIHIFKARIRYLDTKIEWLKSNYYCSSERRLKLIRKAEPERFRIDRWNEIKTGGAK